MRANANELTALSLGAAAELVRTRRASPVELTRACLEQIGRRDAELNAFITVTAEAALQEARRCEQEITAGNYRGPLHGIPVALKDLIDTAGVRTTAGSNLFRERVPVEDAAVVQRLRAAGAVLIGKTNLHEFAYGGSSVVSAFGAVRNPVDRQRTAGGSSGGSAAAVAAGMCYAALGTDTAGSIRLPAAYCGVVGMKPSYGLVSACGVVPLSWTFDHVGPITRTVEDAALVLAVVAESGAEAKLRTLRAGVAREYFFADLHPEIAARVEEAIRALSTFTAETREIAVPVDTDRTVHAAEAWAYHAPLVAQHAEKYQPETLRRVHSGEQVNAADYIRARQQVDRLRREAAHLFAQVDVVVTPTSPLPPPAIAELTANPGELRAQELLMLRNTRPFNVLGLPAITVPCGNTSTGLPVGVQLAAAFGQEALLFQVAQRLQNSL